MSRVQLALDVADIEEAVGFYAKLFNTEPATRRPGYANFAIAEPPLKLVLLENADRAPGTLDHLGVEVGSADEVADADMPAGPLGSAVAGEPACCTSRPEPVSLPTPRTSCC